jgi:hypothetical protein
MIKRFDNAIDALVKGFMNGTLVKGTCTACAVGNIVAKAVDGKITKTVSVNGLPKPNTILDFSCSVSNAQWGTVFLSGGGRDHQERRPYNYHSEAREQIDATGYTWEELARVELAFESNTKISHTWYSSRNVDACIQDQYNGLMAVVDVLCEIEGIVDTQKYKALFSLAD